MLYNALRKLLFLFSPETAHYFSMNSLKIGCSIPLVQNIIQKKVQFKHLSLYKNLFGLTFRNPVGIGAGFDKNALYLNELNTLGFGFIEIGTVTPKPQNGNGKPRLFRLPKDEALINRMGFNNDGVEIIKTRLEKWNDAQRSTVNGKLIIGGNIGKNKTTANEDAWKDYAFCFKALFNCVDYFAVNVSSPNTPGLRALQDKDSLRKILSELQHVNISYAKQKPLLLKIAPDLNQSQLDDVISLALEVKLDGIVATNTTITRTNLVTSKNEIERIGAGGLSGKPLKKQSTEILKYITQNSGKQIPVIASGGIFTAEDAIEKINAGASLIQVWTGFIYEGPSIVKKINKALVN